MNASGSLSFPASFFLFSWGLARCMLGVEMDHNEALRQQAAEKYVLGELPPTLRDEYEEHYFECEECAEDVRAAAEFVDNVRAVLRAAA